MGEQWTVRRLLAWAAQYLQDYKVESARTSAELMLAQVLGLRRIDLYLDQDRPLSKQELADFKALLLRRRAHEPMAYITGVREFWSIELCVGPGVLVPRPETELLVEEGLRLLKDIDAPRILDMCTGSGAVALALAKELPWATVLATDISAEALTYARRNAQNHNLTDRVQFGLGPLWEPVAAAGGFFDLITANPPYVTEEEYRLLPVTVAEFEPRLALEAGPDGLDVIRHIIAGSRAFLRPFGWLLIEIGAGQGRAAVKLAQAAGIFTEVRLLQDLAGLGRVLACGRGDYG